MKRSLFLIGMLGKILPKTLIRCMQINIMHKCLVVDISLASISKNKSVIVLNFITSSLKKEEHLIKRIALSNYLFIYVYFLLFLLIQLMYNSFQGKDGN